MEGYVSEELFPYTYGMT